MAKINYDAINFKNKDVDKFATKFGHGDPIKEMLKAKDAIMNSVKPSSEKPKDNFEFYLEDQGGHGPVGAIRYTTDTTGLAAGKKSFDMRYGSGVPLAGKKVGEMTSETVKRLVKNQGKKK